ncbi:hypothetical protein REC12_09720 [Desulfosporosinus sp. PR]|uniref:hypothetical protein n=1 Tax=Candidatus Desulfosporosinus nitrosoreducens TaxID=3401928 RepID=UPI0027F8DB30|nr:hypothetical protein [Desulfosporosinus sp. PR]MDQ7093870.1 hypothetical protein [Desulfosporosinus sp. PR]
MLKKLLYFLTLSILLVALVSCGTNNPGQTNTNTNTNTSTDNKITYTKEFPYLPSYNSTAAAAYAPAGSKDQYAAAIYIIPNTTDTKVYQNYEAIFKKDGWTITQEQAVVSFSAKKESHIANVKVQIFGSDVKLTVQSK